MIYYIYFLRPKSLSFLIFSLIFHTVDIPHICSKFRFMLVSVGDFSFIYLGLLQSLGGKPVLFS